MNGSRTQEASSLHHNHCRGRIHCLQAASRLALALLLTGCLVSAATAQSSPTASRAGDLQFGGGFVFGNSDYNFNRVSLNGGAFYITFDKRSHWGYEGDFRQVKPASDATVYERTYEIGPRFYLTKGRFVPYAKVLYGRGVYNFSGNVANIAYNIYTFGGGADFLLTQGLNLRGDYEYQNWQGFPLSTLHPGLITIGIAFHFRQ
ncbi:MAG TPA: outer membrane beta-barrel protein [Acidobacteriaceae bacterium]|nr:outer membrane beta-barrel protein [Acidobacteriaceae bacterium]